MLDLFILYMNNYWMLYHKEIFLSNYFKREE